MQPSMQLISLATLQLVCKKLEEEMILFLLRYTPCENMQVCDIKTIARFAGDQAFRTFDQTITTAAIKKNDLQKDSNTDNLQKFTTE